MNEFLEQFVLESRELVDQGTQDLLALEAQPGDRPLLDSAFRAFHTLKGGAGIVDFHAMARALHAAEDALAAVRAGSQAIGPQLISHCLTALDQVVQWLDAIEDAGDLPAGADSAADRVAQLFAASEKAAEPAAADAGWAQALHQRHPQARAVSAFRYTPPSGAFFEGQDPAAVVMAMGGLEALEIEPADGAWPPLEAMDPFACQLTITGLSALSAEAVRRELAAAVALECVDLAGAAAATSKTLAAQAILDEQVLLLRQPGEGMAGRIGSAGRAAANALRILGRGIEAERLEQALEISQRNRDPASLAYALEAALAGSLGPMPAAAPAAADAVQSLRVEVGRVEALVALAGEFSVARNALGHAAAQAANGADAGSLAAMLMDQRAVLDRLVDELQHAVLELRVLPLRHVFQRFPRLVRDISANLDRPARLVLEGEDTQADKAVVEALFEPLLHVVRNALDHGVESAEERAAAGKPAVATLRLRAAREGEQVLIEIEDDGRGLDPDRLRAVAAERGLASDEELAAMSDEQAAELIFAPGFSTAAAVTDLSGRGVGMDAVRTAIARLRGRVSICSRMGVGTTVTFALPFTVMMTRVMTVESGGQVFGIPIEAVVETVRVPRSELTPIGAAKAFVLRGKTIPVMELGEALEERGQLAAGDADLVVASIGGHLGAVEVERLGERMDVMLKPMEGLLAGMPWIAGTTVLGDGRVLLVLDLQELLQ